MKIRTVKDIDNDIRTEIELAASHRERGNYASPGGRHAISRAVKACQRRIDALVKERKAVEDAEAVTDMYGNQVTHEAQGQLLDRLAHWGVDADDIKLEGDPRVAPDGGYWVPVAIWIDPE